MWMPNFRGGAWCFGCCSQFHLGHSQSFKCCSSLISDLWFSRRDEFQKRFLHERWSTVRRSMWWKVLVGEFRPDQRFTRILFQVGLLEYCSGSVAYFCQRGAIAQCPPKFATVQAGSDLRTSSLLDFIHIRISTDRIKYCKKRFNFVSHHKILVFLISSKSKCFQFRDELFLY